MNNQKIGDIFEFRISDNSYVYGQIIHINNDVISVIIFKDLYNSRPTVDEILSTEILFLGNTLDAKFYHKHWIVIGNQSNNLENIALPYYKIGTSPVYIENFHEKRIRKANRFERKNLSFREIVAPVRFELAIKAYYKITEWKPRYDDLLYQKTVESNNMVRKDLKK